MHAAEIAQAMKSDEAREDDTADAEDCIEPLTTEGKMVLPERIELSTSPLPINRPSRKTHS